MRTDSRIPADYDAEGLAVVSLERNGWVATSWHPKGPQVFPHPRQRFGPSAKRTGTWVSCPICEMERTIGGYDPSLVDSNCRGLAGVAFACCGHDDIERAYAVTVNGRMFRGRAARWHHGNWLKTREAAAVLLIQRAGWVRRFWWINGRFTPRGLHGSCQLPKAECTCGTRALQRSEPFVE